MKNESKIFIPFEKVDKDKKMVYGYISTEVEDSQGEVVKRKAIKKAWADYMKFANIREMHQPSAVGVTKEFMHDKHGTWIGAKIVDKDAWEKVKEKVYKGFSIGGRVLEKVGNVIKAIELFEISIVDRPANPEAVFEMVKRDDSKQKVELIVKIFDNIMKKEVEKVRRRKKKPVEEVKEEKEIKEEETEEVKEEKEVKEEEVKEEGTEEVKEEEKKDTVENQESGAQEEGTETVENKESADGIEKDDEEEDDDDDDEEEEEETEEDDDEDEEEEEEDDEEEEVKEEVKEEIKEEEKVIKPSNIKKDVHEVVALSDVAGNLKWLVSAFENNKRAPAVIKLINKALDSVMGAISLEAKKDTKKGAFDIEAILTKKFGEMTEQLTKANSAKVEKLEETVTSLEEQIKKFGEQPVSERPKKSFAVEKGKEGGKGDNEPKDITTLRKEVMEIQKEIDEVYQKALALSPGANPEREAELKKQLADLAVKFSLKKQELRASI